MAGGGGAGGTRSTTAWGRCSLVAVAWTLAASACTSEPATTIEIAVPASDELFAGDLLTLDATASGTLGSIDWATSDERIAAVNDGTVEARRPGSVTITASAARARSARITLTVTQRPGGYTAQEVDYFSEIAFGADVGGATLSLRRWRAGSGPQLRIHGTPTSGDRLVLDSVIGEINRLLPVDIEIVSGSESADIHFVPPSEFRSIVPETPDNVTGLVWLWWTSDQYLLRSVVLVSSTEPEAVRAHVIREEVTQMLGLLRDSFAYPRSIFYQDFSTVTEYLPIDRVVMELLYRPELAVGTDLVEATRVARTLTRTSPRMGSAHSRWGPVPGVGGVARPPTVRTTPPGAAWLARPGSGGNLSGRR